MYVSRCTVYMYIWYCEYVYMVYVSGICIINCFTLATHEIAHSDRGSVVKHCKGYSGINSYSTVYTAGQIKKLFFNFLRVFAVMYHC